jgi:hypothetical protein
MGGRAGTGPGVDGIQVHKVETVSQSTEQAGQCMDLEHCLHWLHLEPTHLALEERGEASAVHQSRYSGTSKVDQRGPDVDVRYHLYTRGVCMVSGECMMCGV